MARCCQRQHPQLILHVSMQDIAGLPTFVQAGVKAVHADHVELDRATTLQLDQTIPRNTVQPASSKLPYDYLVICTGAASATGGCVSRACF